MDHHKKLYQKIILDSTHPKSNTEQSSESSPLEPLAKEFAGVKKKTQICNWSYVRYIRWWNQ